MINKDLQDLFHFSSLGFAHLEKTTHRQNNTADYRFLCVNPAFAKISGINEKNITGKTVDEVLPASEGSGWRGISDIIAAGSGVTTFEYYIAETGRWFIVNVWHTDETHLAITLTDNTTGRHYTEYGSNKELQQHAFWDNNLFGVMIADKDGNYVDANAEACRMTGYSCEELKKMKLFQIVDPQEMEEARKHFEQIRKTGKAYGEVAFYTKSGEKRWWNVVSTQLSGEYCLGLHEDITERKKAEQALAKSEERFRLLIKNISAIIVILDNNGIQQFVSPAAEKITGYTPEELTGKSLTEVIHPDDLPLVMKAWEEGTGDPTKEISVRYRHKHKTKGWVCLETVGQGFLNEPAVNAVIAIVHDITERRQTEEDLRLRSIVLDQIRDHVTVTDLNGVITYVNQSVPKTMKRDINEIIGQSTGIYGEDPVRGATQQEILSQTLQMGDWRGEVVNYSADGKEHIMDCRTQIVYDKTGAPIALCGISTDITERKRAEASLKEKELKFRTLFENSSDAIFIMKGDTFIECNSATLQIYGCQSPDQILGKTPFDFSPAHQPNGRDSREYALEIINTAIGGATQLFEWTHTKRDGTLFTAEVKLNKLELNGQRLLQAIVRDITERKQAEEELHQTQNNLANKEAQYRLLAENSRDLIYVYSLVPEPHYEYISPSCLQLTGFRPEEGYADPYAYHKYINTPEGIERFSQFLLDPGQPTVIEEEWQRKDGTRVWVEQVISRNFDENGHLISFQSTVRDISIRKRAEEALHKLSQAVEQSPAGVIISNTDGVIEYVNPKFSEVTGYTKEEVIGQKTKFIAASEQPDEIYAELRENISSGKEWKGEYQTKRKSGELYWESVSISPIYNKSGTITHFLEVKEDITQRKSTELEIEKNRAELRAIYDNAPVMMAVIDENRNLLFANPSFTAFTGVPEAELTGGRACGVFGCINAAEDPKGCGFGTNCKACSLLRSIEDSFINGSTHKDIEYNTTLVRNNTEKAISLLSSVAPIRFAGKRLLLLSFIDISERKQAEEALRQVSARLSLATKAGGVGVWDWDCVTNTLIWDDQMYALYGISRNVFSGALDAWKSALHPEDSERTNLEISQALSGGCDFNTEFRIVWPDGSVHYIRALAMVARNSHGSPLRMIGTNWDITERKQAEEALQTSDDIVRTIPSGLFIYQFESPDKLILLNGNPAAKQLTGLIVSDWIGREFNELWPQARQEGHTREYLKVIETGKTYETEDLYYQDNRLSGAFRVRAFKLAGERLAVAFENITERKQAEAELKASEKKFRELSTLMRLMTDNMPDMLWAKNLNKEYIFANKAICNNLLNALDTEEPLGKTDMYFALRERNAQPGNPQWHTFGEICRDSDSITLEEMKTMQFDEFGNVKGNFLFLDVHKAPLFDEQEQLIGIVGSARDITERKALEKNLNYQTLLRELLMEISSGFINIPLEKVEESVNQALGKMAIFVNADRAYTFDYDWKNEVCHNTYEWCNEGIDPEIQNLQNIPLAVMIEAVEEHQKGNTVCIPDVNAMPDGTAKELMKSQGVQSFIMVPMMNQNDCISFVGFDSVNELRDYSPAEIQLLEVFAQLLSNIKIRKAIVGQLVLAKAQAEESEEKHRGLIEQMLEGLVVDDGHGTILFANPMFCKMTGYAEHELIGKSGYELMLQKDDIEKVKLKDEDRKRNIADQYEIDVVTKSGEARTFWFHATPVKDKDGHVIASMSTVTDITERKKAEVSRRIQFNIAQSIHSVMTAEELLETIRQELSQLFDTTNFFVAMYNPEKDTLKQLLFHDEMDSYDEWDADQSISGQVVKSGKTIFLQGEDINEFTSRTNLNALGTNAACWLGVPVIIHNKVSGVMVIQHYTNPEAYNAADVALLEMVAHETGVYLEKQMMIEDLIRAKDQAEESDRLKSAFLANMSHEIRTPMNGILGFAELLKIPGLSGSEQQEYIAVIEKSGQRMLNIINDIIDISKIEAGLMDIHIAESDISEQLEYIHTFFKPEAEAKKLNFSVKNFLTRKETTLNTDREKLYAILTNLVKNAIKYTGEGEIELGCNRKGHFLEFYVKDTGIGIPEDRQQAVFERFVQADIEDKMAHQGAGLGLAISKAYIEMLGGSIWLESREGVGSVFRFTIPCEGSPGQKREITTDLAADFEKASVSELNILIVEDDAVSERLLEIEMNKSGNTVAKVKSGKDAIEWIRNHPETDVILMDIQLPGMNGYDATRQIRQFNQKVVIIAQTAYGLAGERQKAIEAGCNDYIAKPIKMHELHAILQQHFHK